MSEDILVQDDGSIIRITLNRPEHGNAATDAMAARLIELLDTASRCSRLVVLCGAGDDFCVGRAIMGKAGPAVTVEALARRRQNDIIFDCYEAFRRARVPIVSVVHGRALGFGCALASLSDITLASATARFQIPEMMHNIMPTMVMSAMIDRVSRKALNFLIYSNQMVGAERALSFGIVSNVVPDAQLDQSLESLCKAIIKSPAPAVEGVKEYLRVACSMDVPGAVEYARNLHATINSSSEMRPHPPNKRNED